MTMDKQQAKKIIKDTFESSFDKERFTHFIKNFLNEINEKTFIYKGNYIPDSYGRHISTLERIGKYSDSDNSIDILIVKLKKETSLERARTMQRNFIAWYLNGSRGGQMKDAALAAFVSPGESDWRFSLVKMDYKFEKTKTGSIKVKEELTPARRWSFLVGSNEKSHTAQSRLVDILANDEHNPTLEEIEKSFDIETVTKEFFLKYRELFIRTKEELDKVIKKDLKIEEDFVEKDVDSVNFAKKLLGQIIFLYFLQKKGWFGVGRDDDWGTGSKHFLRELFEKKHSDYKNFFNDILEPLFYEALRIDRSYDDDYYSRFNCKIPFLNGGLFDPIGNYDWVHTDINLPDQLFSNDNRTKEGDIGDGILDVFDRYNFTVQEDEPLEKEVAIDPELLGKAYEKFNAIRPDNYDEYKKALETGRRGEETKFNRKFGVYYTPREIVHYMCQQSLINYLYTRATEVKLSPSINKTDLEDLIEVGELISEHEAMALIKKEKIKDGIQKSSEYTLLLSDSIRENAQLIDEWLTEITVCDPAVGSGAFHLGMMNEIVRARNVLSVFLKDNNRNDYEFKRHCIERSLYGVDIDPGAVEIAKLRLWLSLVVDEEDIKNIKPLPNLDYKIVCGDSLLGVEKSLFNNELFAELERLKPLYFDETNLTRKQEYKEQIEKIISQITNGHTEFDFEVYFSEVFHEKDGFDVVIANPPYVRQEILGNEFKNLMKRKYPEVANGIADLYVYFFAIAFKLFKTKGTIAYITPNKYLKTKYGIELRNTLKKYNVDKIIDFFELPVFEAANDTAITIIKNETQTQNIKYYPISSLENLDLYSLSRGNYLNTQMNETEWIFIGNIQKQILENIYQNSISLKDLVKDKIYSGIKTAFNEAFVLSKEVAKELMQTESKKIIKKYVQSTDIRMWGILDKEKYFLATGYDIDIPKKYPHAFEWLKQFEDALQKRLDKGRNWWNLRACRYYGEFKKPKIIYMHTAKKHEFYLDYKGYYINNSCYMIVSDNKFLLCFLNSKLFEWFKRLKFVAYGNADKGGRCKLDYNKMKTIPIKKITEDQKQPFIAIIDQIFAITKDEDYLQDPQKEARLKALERKIDKLVYQLYGLTKEEIRIVESSTK